MPYHAAMRAFLKRHWALLAILILLLVWTPVFLFVDLPAVIDAIGVHNAYLVVFLFATIGGLSAFASPSFFATVAAFAAGGADPWLLTLFGGLGMFLSDTAFFYLSKRGVEALEGRKGTLVPWLVKNAQRTPAWALMIGTYLYLGFTPLPNDALMIALAVARVPYRHSLPVLAAGSITVVALAAFGGQAIFG